MDAGIEAQSGTPLLYPASRDAMLRDPELCQDECQIVENDAGAILEKRGLEIGAH